MKLNPFVFVVGCPRSGTTLLQRMLDHHPELAVANDTHFIPRAVEREAPEQLAEIERGRVPPLTERVVDAVVVYHRFERLGVPAAEARLLARGCRDLGEFAGRLYTRFAQQRGKRLGGEKTPDYVRRLPLLAGLFPRARVVHIVRDGRDVALSLLDWATPGKGPGRLELWERHPVAACALWWRWQVQSGREAARQGRSGPYHEVSYEALVADPERELTRIAAFLGIPMHPAMLEFHRGKPTSGAGGSAKSQWLPPTAGLRDWRRQLPAEDVALFEALAGDLLDELGLSRSGAAPSVAVRRAAAEAAEWWDGFIQRRERKLAKRIRLRQALAAEDRVGP